MLHVEPETSFDKIRAALLSTLSATILPPYIPEEYRPLPTDPSVIEFGTAKDRWNLSKGWLPLEIPDAGSKKARKGVLNDSPAGAGLRDGSALAFRFKGSASADEREEEEGEGGEDEAGDDEDGTERARKRRKVWDVVHPSLD